MKTALITGCSSGVGYATCLHLARNNWKVFATVRGLEKGEALMKAAQEGGFPERIHLVALDVSKEEEVSKVVEDVLAKAGQLHLLINNAGYSIVKPTELTSLAEFREVFDTNFFGAVAVTKAIIPHMRANKAGHIINISSYGGLVGQPFNDAYCAAKFALSGWSESLYSTLYPFGIHVSLVCPGAINSAFLGKAAGTAVYAENAYSPLQKMYVDNIKAVFASNQATGVKSSQSPEEIAEILWNLVNSEEPHQMYLTSEYISNLAAVKYKDITGDSVAEMTMKRSFGGKVKL
eukprot:TRINITY_DN26285_c0_g1_i1.p1 TRINITY_DN26285_c0_g1~~TRINITY_DN26285_c0_g1_i1.p1  ORF type:complete len:291 (-),score=68.14 TRINITY_DN26285_c0_g1_i1:7-879(-)